MDELMLEQLTELNSHMANLEYIGIVILVGIGLCFGGICLSVLSRYVRG